MISVLSDVVLILSTIELVNRIKVFRGPFIENDAAYICAGIYLAAAR